MAVTRRGKEKGRREKKEKGALKPNKVPGRKREGETWTVSQGTKNIED